MKKILLSVFVFFVAVTTASAARVSLSSAEEIARNFLGSKAVEMVWDGTGMTKSALSAPEFYAFNGTAGGWVIVASDDCASPVLAYCDSGLIDLSNLPSNMKNYLRGVTTNIRKASAAGIQAAPAAKAAWSSRGLFRTKAAGETLLQTASWHQNSPYNATVKTKLKTTKNVYAGCVATAMAIVLRHHQFPSTGKGTIPSYTSVADRESYGVSETYSVPSTDIGSYTYNWSAMPLTGSSSAVADLIFHCGAMVQMTYSTKGSGANSADILPALIQYMSYSKGASEIYRYYYSDAEWLNMIKKEIDASRPIIYGGMDEQTEEGHQFVLDGYNSDGYVHVNWGWAGECNGWFAVSYLGDRKSSGMDNVLSYWDSGIFGLEPDPNGTSTGDPALYIAPYEGNCGIRLVSGTIAKGQSFVLDLGAVYNEYPTVYNGKIKAVLLDRSGAIKESLGEERALTIDAIDSYGYLGETSVNGYSCRISGDIAFGDCIAFCYTDSKGGWKVVGAFNHQDSDAEYSGFMVNKMSAVAGISFINLPSNLVAGNLLYPEFIPSTRGLKKAVAWTLDGTSIKDGYIKLTSGVHTLKAVVSYTDGTSETLTRKFQVK